MTREEIEQEIRNLKQELFYSEDFGDWKMARAMETLLDKLSTAKTIIGLVSVIVEIKTSLAETIAKRVETRTRIEELERELENAEEN